MKYRVLWIDDEPSEEFMDRAEDFELLIENVTCYSTGLAKLQAEKDLFQAVILDVNCKVNDDENEAPSMETFTDYFHRVASLCEQGDNLVPWFVYTGGGYDGADSVARVVYNHDWDDRKYYNKPDDYKLLFERLKSAVDASPLVQMARKYEDIFTIYDGNKLGLYRILYALEKNNFTNASVMNDIRKILGWVASYMRDHGLLPSSLYKISSVKWCFDQLTAERAKRLLGSFPVPLYVKNEFISCADACQNGSHGMTEGDLSSGQTLYVDSDISEGKAPYLVRRTIFELFDIITWCGRLPKTAEGIKKLADDVNPLYVNFNPNK